MSGHSIPIPRDASDTQRVFHYQAMAQMARVMNEQGDLAGFRPGFMERKLVQLGHADPSLLVPERSERSKRKALAKRNYLDRLHRQQGRHGGH